MTASFLAVILPILFWQGSANTAPELQKAGITRVAVPSPELASWRTIAGISAEPADITAAIKLPPPGVALKIDEASASRIPWVSSNGWRFMRQPRAKFYYNVPANIATLAAAEAFCYGAEALVHTDAEGIEPLAKMLEFLTAINSDEAKPLADVEYVDNGSAASAEVMNLMIRDNLLFKTVPEASGRAKLSVQLGSKDYPAANVKDADSIVHKIRGNLTDDRRFVRIFGTSVVIVHVAGEVDKPRLHLLNYGSGAHIRVGGFRVRVLGRYARSQIHSFDGPNERLLDYEVQADATEFTVPELKTYAVVDLAR